MQVSTLSVSPNGRASCREIRKFQRTTDLVIPKAPFMRLVKEILQDVNSKMLKSHAEVDTQNRYRVTPQCLEALQEAAEGYLVQLFEDSNLAAIHAKRVTVMCGPICFGRAFESCHDAASARFSCCVECIRLYELSATEVLSAGNWRMPRFARRLENCAIVGSQMQGEGHGAGAQASA